MSKSYGKVRALSGVILGLPCGITILLGRNGSGKSTLSRLLAGVEQPDKGHVLRGGRPIDDGPRERRAHLSRTGWLPQSFSALGTMTVRQYVSYAGWLKDLAAADLPAAVDAALAAVELGDLGGRRMGQLSGGMLRRAGIAQAIVNAPDLLVLDEPTAGLDPEQRGTFHELVRRLAVERAVLLSTHLLEDVIAVGDRTVVLDAGQVRFQGTNEQLMHLGDGGGGAAARLRSGFLALLAPTQQ